MRAVIESLEGNVMGLTMQEMASVNFNGKMGGLDVIEGFYATAGGGVVVHVKLSAATGLPNAGR